MKTIEGTLKKLDSYLYTIKRDTVKGWYVLEVGIPIAWTYKSTDRVVCEEIGATEKMAMIKINPSEDAESVIIDDLINFAIQIVSSNKKIEKMREDFDKKMETIKEKLEEEYEKFETEIEGMEEGLFEGEEEEKVIKKKVKEKTEIEKE